MFGLKEWWVSCDRFTVWVQVDERAVITDAAPIVRRFIGQPLQNLKRWANKFGGVRSTCLTLMQEKERS